MELTTYTQVPTTVDLPSAEMCTLTEAALLLGRTRQAVHSLLRTRALGTYLRPRRTAGGYYGSAPVYYIKRSEVADLIEDRKKPAWQRRRYREQL